MPKDLPSYEPTRPMSTRSGRPYKMSDVEGEDSKGSTGAASGQAVEEGVPPMAFMQFLQEQQRQFLAQQEAQRQAAAEQQAAQQRIIEQLMAQQQEEMCQH